jgi:hypothetical protein
MGSETTRTGTSMQLAARQRHHPGRSAGLLLEASKNEEKGPIADCRSGPGGQKVPDIAAADDQSNGALVTVFLLSMIRFLSLRL